MKRLCNNFLFFLMASFLTILPLSADQIQPLLDVGEVRQKAEEKSQTKIDQADDDTSLIVEPFSVPTNNLYGHGVPPPAKV